MYASSGDRLLTQHCNQNGFYYIKPNIDPRSTPALVEVPFNGGVNLCNTSNGDVYQHMDWVPTPAVMNNGVSTCVAAPNTNQQIQNTTSSTAGWPNTQMNIPTFSGSTLADRTGWSNRSGVSLNPAAPTRNPNVEQVVSWHHSCNIPGERTGPFQTALSSWTTSNIRQGVRIISATELRRMKMPDTPTKFNADPHFNDSLWMSLQGDILPSGANPLDDYMHGYRDSRARIYLEAAIDNQGCSCEHDKTNLDKYLTRNKDVTSAIALRATLSDECRRQVQEPTESRILKDYAQTLKGQAEQLLKAAQALCGQPENTRRTPWDAYGEDEAMLIV